jgi:3-oxoacyl-[acyl-carrier-protein] synthase-1
LVFSRPPKARGDILKRVVVTGIGVVSSIGNNKDEVLDSLKNSRSGIEFAPEYAEIGMRSQIHGSINIDTAEHIDKRLLRFMGPGAAWNYIAMKEAIEDSGLEANEVSNPRTGVIAGSGGPSTSNQVLAVDTAREKSVKRIGPFMVPRCMSSTNSANMATAFQIKGMSYSISSACSTSAHCIGNAYESIQLGKQDVMFAGGGEELHWTLSMLFDAMGAMSSKYNDTPQEASRAYDAGRDGFVISGGGGMLVLEELEHAKARGAKIYAEIVGYGATSDGVDMVAPSGEGAMRCMGLARATIGDTRVDYVNAHGTATPVGDIIELNAIREVFGDDLPRVSSTKSLTGHSQGAAGVQESIYSLLMLHNDFLTKSVNVFNPDEGVGDYPLVLENVENAGLNCVMSNSFGFGGTNASLVFKKLAD